MKKECFNDGGLLDVQRDTTPASAGRCENNESWNEWLDQLPPTYSEKWSVWFCEEQLFSFGERTFVDSFKFKLFIGSVSEWEPANEILCGSLIGFVGLGRQCSSKFIPNFSIPTCLMKHSTRIIVLPGNNKSNQPDFTTVALTMCCFNWHTHNRKQFYAVFFCVVKLTPPLLPDYQFQTPLLYPHQRTQDTHHSGNVIPA